MTEEDVAILADVIVRSVKQQVAVLEQRQAAIIAACASAQAKAAVLEARCLELETKLAAVEQKAISFRGVWRSGDTYAVGDAVSDHGSLWICRAPTPGRPNVDHFAWVLAVKRGQAA